MGPQRDSQPGGLEAQPSGPASPFATSPVGQSPRHLPKIASSWTPGFMSLLSLSKQASVLVSVAGIVRRGIMSSVFTSVKWRQWHPLRVWLFCCYNEMLSSKCREQHLAPGEHMEVASGQSVGSVRTRTGLFSSVSPVVDGQTGPRVASRGWIDGPTGTLLLSHTRGAKGAHGV
ncbi:uncharacterized protein LOC119873002 isoform X2 [Canis lupus familiaris]|uniref:uncharacterized protein LOC119873002 isoform X2 n=1 Tax=Canis lupus familiaris TaxID=9615 RepID=UPI0018F2B313|nr:uncharacterized protein LOC119873002 isoform X2 [Canis lupus familiaris]XP_038455153.1 uncharacterized protein LOC119873002 isoform X2 [Canis lupus familiaris]XP_038528896.1 uncharacterized protein LOC119873002 isoform X2 [Canis lupus familiaris]